jgi:phosphoglycolate phosphatase
LTAHEALLVGDSAVDVETGRHAGVVTVAVAHGYGDPAQLKAAAPDAFINNLGELVTLASQRGW